MAVNQDGEYIGKEENQTPQVANTGANPIGDWIGNVTGYNAQQNALSQMSKAGDTAKEATDSSRTTTKQAIDNLFGSTTKPAEGWGQGTMQSYDQSVANSIGTNADETARMAQNSGRGLASELGQQAATGAGVSAVQSARAAGLNKGQSALVGAQQAGNVYGNTYGNNVQQGITNYGNNIKQTNDLASNMANRQVQGAQLGQGQAGTELTATGQAQQSAQNLQKTGVDQANAVVGGVGQLIGNIIKSDERSKNISGSSSNIDNILAKIKPINYSYKSGEGSPEPRIGVTAQSLENTPMSAAVKTDANGTKMIDTNELSPMTLNLVIQLAQQVASLKEQLKGR